jgi:hypothetical protein
MTGAYPTKVFSLQADRAFAMHAAKSISPAANKLKSSMVYLCAAGSTRYCQ